MPKHSQEWLVENALKRFRKYTDRNGPVPSHRPELGRCWIWMGRRDRNGYGLMGAYRGYMLAHRFSLEIAKKERLDGLLAIHLCDIRPCVNPDHLMVGTRIQNQFDRNHKVRTGAIPKNKIPATTYKPRSGAARGERCGTSKIKEDDVREIRRLVEDGEVFKSDIAKRFGINWRTVVAIAKRHTWRHVE